MKLLVLGAHGFIGRHVAHGLANMNIIVRADLDPGPGELALPPYPHVDDLRRLLDTTVPDVIVNCTGAASVPASIEAPARDYALNVDMVLQCLEAIRLSNAGTRLVHLSSAAVYGNPPSLPVGEEAPIAPVSPYGMHKSYAEMLCREYARFFSAATVSLRVFSAYGPDLRKQLFWDVYRKSRAEGPLQFFGTGEETRDYIYIADVVTAIGVVIDNANFDGRAINVASGVETSTRAAVTLLLEKLNTPRALEFSGSARQGDPDHWRADISSLAALGFKPAYDISRGLEATAAWLGAQK